MRQSASHHEKNNDLKNRKYKHNYLTLIYIPSHIKKQSFINKNRQKTTKDNNENNSENNNDNDKNNENNNNKKKNDDTHDNYFY